MTFHVGQKVICVDAEPRHGRALNIVEGEIYTIIGFPPADAVAPGVLLLEAKNPRSPSYGYLAARFRPLVEPNTDISIFKKMLLPSGREREDA